MGMHPSQYNATVLTGTSTSTGVSFGFNATYVRVVNQQGDSYVNFGSTAVGTTGGAVLSSGAEIAANIVQCAGMGVASLSTGAGVDVLALG